MVIALVAVLVLIALAFAYPQVSIPLILVVTAYAVVPKIVRNIRKNRYFASEGFAALKAEAAAVVAEHNEIATYVADMRSRGSFELGASNTGFQAHLAEFENTSAYNYRRDRNVAEYEAANVHNCSLQVVRNASADPIKYLMKYFDIKPSEERLADVEDLSQSIARLEDAIENLQRRERSITEQIRPPAFILQYFKYEFMAQVGVTLSPVTVPYPVYAFAYVSAGGNSSQRTTITMDTATIDALIETMSEKIPFRKSAEGQRALMTARLRAAIKTRHEFKCQQCGVSIDDEPHLLLEVDHIHPLSRGGLSTMENLQTLCWRCNRAKSDKVLDG